MKSAPNHYEALNLLRQRLDSADPVIEQCLKAHKDKSEVYDDLKHNAFQEINSVLIALKGLADTIEPELNTRQFIDCLKNLEIILRVLKVYSSAIEIQGCKKAANQF